MGALGLRQLHVTPGRQLLFTACLSEEFSYIPNWNISQALAKEDMTVFVIARNPCTSTYLGKSQKCQDLCKDTEEKE